MMQLLLLFVANKEGKKCSIYYFLLQKRKGKNAVFTTFCGKKFVFWKEIFKTIFNMIFEIDLQRKKNLQKKSSKTKNLQKRSSKKKSSIKIFKEKKSSIKIFKEKNLQKRSSKKRKSSKKDLQNLRWDSNPCTWLLPISSSVP